MLVVSDTSPISNLARIGRLDLLEKQFIEIWIPFAVDSELRADHDAHALAEVIAAMQANWLRSTPVTGNQWLNILTLGVHRGEAEAIALALERSADMVLIDERDGRRLAVQAGLQVTGVLGVLLRAKKDNDIAPILPEIDRLRKVAHFFIDPELERKVLLAAGE